MPTYRKLYTKVLDSADFNAMPNDFTRVLWLVLPLRCDRAGRALDDPLWLKSVLFPRRHDVTTEQIESAMCWLASRRMITRYEVRGELYFHILSWDTYQTGTDREAPSYIPAPPKSGRDKVVMKSGGGQEGGKHAVTDTAPVLVPDTAPECVKAVEEIKPPSPPAEVGARIEQPDADKPAVHPALQVWRDCHKGHYPQGAIWQDMIALVGDDPANVTRWKDTQIAYIASGWNPENYLGMKDYFKRGELPSVKPKQTGTAGKAARIQAHWDAKLKAAQGKPT